MVYVLSRPTLIPKLSTPENSPESATLAEVLALVKSAAFWFPWPGNVVDWSLEFGFVVITYANSPAGEPATGVALKGPLNRTFILVLPLISKEPVCSNLPGKVGGKDPDCHPWAGEIILKLSISLLLSITTSHTPFVVGPKLKPVIGSAVHIAV